MVEAHDWEPDNRALLGPYVGRVVAVHWAVPDGGGPRQAWGRLAAVDAAGPAPSWKMELPPVYNLVSRVLRLRSGRVVVPGRTIVVPLRFEVTAVVCSG